LYGRLGSSRGVRRGEIRGSGNHSSALELPAMTPAELKKMYEEWERNSANHDEVESSDNYYWAGAASFRNFLEKRLEDLSVR
jgi:hypothetical protein